MRKAWSTKEIKELQALFQNGFSGKEISVFLKRSLQSVNRALSRFDLRKDIKKTTAPTLSITLPTIENEGLSHIPIAHMVFARLPLNQWQGFSRQLIDFSFCPTSKKESLKIPVIQKAPPQSTFPVKKPSNSFDTAIAWAHAHTSLRILPVKKGLEETFFYVRDIKNLQDKKYLTKDSLIKLIDIYRKNLGVPPFSKSC